MPWTRHGSKIDVLHHVDLATAGPTNLVDVVTEHPEGRPGPCFGWHFNPGFNPAVAGGHAMLGDDARAGDAAISLPPCRNGKVAVSRKSSIARRAGVVLDLLAAPATCT